MAKLTPAGTGIDNTATQNPCGDQVSIYRAVIRMSSLSKPQRREITDWLVKHCGKPDRNRGFWWTDEGPGPGETTISFALADRFVEFSLRWC
jgi:hypothetical protein